jgi:putative FmdB family regulatory protein
MPIYEYKCPNGHLFEVFHSMSDSGPTTCEVCGAEPLQRVLHPVAVHYKGSGFYSTDYGRGGRKPKDGGGSGDSSSSSDGGSSSSDSSSSSSPYNAETTKKIKESGGGSSKSGSSD